jgi:hypothetical protein
MPGRCYRKLKKPGKAAELYFHSGAYEKAAALYKKLKNTDMLARCWEKTGDHYQLALLHQKAKRIDEAVACFARHAAQSEENREQLLAEAERLDGGRTALKAALRFSALGRYERSAPVFFQKGYLDAALRDYERCGDHEGAATCHHARGEYDREAEAIEKSSHPDREELAAGALYRHLRMGWLSKKPPAPALSAEAERFMQQGEYARALIRFKALQDAEGVYRAYLHLDRNEEALSYLVSRVLFEEAEEYVREKQDLDVTPGVVRAVFDELREELDIGGLESKTTRTGEHVPAAGGGIPWPATRSWATGSGRPGCTSAWATTRKPWRPGRAWAGSGMSGGCARSCQKPGRSRTRESCSRHRTGESPRVSSIR